MAFALHMSAFDPKRTFGDDTGPPRSGSLPFLRHAEGVSFYVREGAFMDQLEHIKKSAVIKRSIFINGHNRCSLTAFCQYDMSS